ncbi:MAG: hypothetical protein MZW92_72630 [Comamonadaceae bacterium]|nr:hypothetical protein [Comamonadaceae bacterium]
MEYLRLRGIGVSPGIVLGEVVLADRILFPAPKESSRLPRHSEELAPRSTRPSDRTRERNHRPSSTRSRQMVGEEHALHLRRPPADPRRPGSAPPGSIA